MKIGIIGGGNMGCVLATKFSQHNEVTLYTNLTDVSNLYEKDMKVFLEDNNSYYSARIACITTDIKELCSKSDYIFITFPSFLFAELCEHMLPYINESHHLFFVPGSGGAELAFKNVLSKGATISGLQRVHSVARIITFGKLTKESGIRKELFVGSIPNSYNAKAVKVVENLYGIKTSPLRNYLNVTLINSNPILHTSRLFSMLKNYSNDTKLKTLPLFYEDWTEDSSKLLINMDNELFSIINRLNSLGLEVHQIKPLLEHYESENANQLTRKIHSIKSFAGIGTPSVIRADGFIAPDFSSRYFTADFPYGLDILLAFSGVVGIKCPNMELVSRWYHLITKTKQQFKLDKFGIANETDLVDFYKQ